MKMKYGSVWDAGVVLMIASTSSYAAAPAAPGLANGSLVVVLGLLCAVLTFALVLTLLRRKQPVRGNEVEGPMEPVAVGDIVQSAKDAIFIIQETGEIQFTNPSAEKLFGYSFSELQGKSIAVLIPPPATGRRRTNYIQSAEGRELSGVRKSGDRFPLDLVLSELGNGSKRFSIIVRDRSERNRAEREIEEGRRFSASVLDRMPGLLVVTDHEGRVVRFNRACEDLTQFSEGEIRGQYLWQAVSAPAEMEAAEEQAQALLAGEFPSRSESVWYLRDQSLRTISWANNAIRDDYGRVTHVVSIGFDVTNRTQWEERRRETEALSAAGRLAGGVAHDFNNLLTAITGYSGLLLGTLEHEDPARNDVEEIKRASDHGAAITRQLLAFSGKHPRNPKPISLNDVVKNVERLLKVMMGDSVHLDLSLESDLPLVHADRELLEECVMHLAANAREAMRTGGTLQIQTGVRSLTRKRLDARPPIGPGEYVTLSVVDTGSGIAPDALPHIFEPYYTTKDSPKSNGMGLAIVYGVVRQSEGSIVVHSAPKYGSTFRIFLPLAPNQPKPRIQEEEPEEALFGEETILLAMEPDFERKKLREMLESAQYRVLEARSSLQALEIAHKSSEMIHALVADVAFLRMAGTDLANSIQMERPGIRVLFATSRTDGNVPAEAIRIDRALQRRTLLQRLRTTLKQASTEQA